jgi:hypothetical protein
VSQKPLFPFLLASLLVVFGLPILANATVRITRLLISSPWQPSRGCPAGVEAFPAVEPSVAPFATKALALWRAQAKVVVAATAVGASAAARAPAKAAPAPAPAAVKVAGASAALRAPTKAVGASSQSSDHLRSGNTSRSRVNVPATSLNETRAGLAQFWHGFGKLTFFAHWVGNAPRLLSCCHSPTTESPQRARAARAVGQ